MSQILLILFSVHITESMAKKNLLSCHNEVNIQWKANAEAKWHHSHLDLIPVSLAFSILDMLAACHHAGLTFCAELRSMGKVGRNGLMVETLLCEPHPWRRKRGRITGWFCANEHMGELYVPKEACLSISRAMRFCIFMTLATLNLLLLQSSTSCA